MSDYIDMMLSRNAARQERDEALAARDMMCRERDAARKDLGDALITIVNLQADLAGARTLRETDASSLSDHLQHDHPTEPNARVQSLAIQIVVEFTKQGNELDNLGDGESVVFMGKCPTINVVQLAEKINTYREAEADTLKYRIGELENDLEILEKQMEEAAEPA